MDSQVITIEIDEALKESNILLKEENALLRAQLAEANRHLHNWKSKYCRSKGMNKSRNGELEFHVYIDYDNFEKELGQVPPEWRPE